MLLLFTSSLKDEKAFTAAFKKGKRFGGKCMAAFYRKNRLPLTRLGISIGKKAGGAVTRNRIKRVIREGYRQSELKMPIGYDIVITPRAEAATLKPQDLAGFFARLSREMRASEKDTDHRNKALPKNPEQG